MGNDRQLFSGFIGAALMTGTNLLVSFVQLRLLVINLPLQEAGIWIIYLNIGLYILLLDMGLSPTLGREISLLSGMITLSPEVRSKRVGSLVRSCTAIVSGLAVVVFVLGLTFGWFYVKTLIPTYLRSEARFAWTIFIAGASVNLIGEGWFAGIYGLGHVFQERMIRAIGLIVGLALMAVAISCRFGLTGLAIAYFLQASTTVLLARTAFARVGREASSSAELDLIAIRRMVVPSVKYAATLLGGILILQTDNLVIASCLGPAMVPDYQAISKIVNALMTLSMMLIVSSTPFISRAYASLQLAEVLRLLNRNLRYTLSVMVLLGSFVACFADHILSIWLGRGHFVGFGIVIILLLVMLLEAHHSTMAAATMAASKIAFFVPALLAGFLNILFSVILAKHYGLIGVACGTLFAQVLTNNWYCPWYTMKLFDIPIREHLRQIILPVVGYLLLMVGVGLSVRICTRSLAPGGSLAVGVLASASIGLLYFWLVMLTASERRLIITKVQSLQFGQKITVSDT